MADPPGYAFACGQFEVATAVDGLDALRRLTPDSGIDLIISDSDMPGMSGLDLLRTFRGNDNAIRVIILTGTQEVRSPLKPLKR